MALYTCGNRGQCSFADGGRKFTWSDRGTPICPGCGRSEFVRPTGGFDLQGLMGSKWFWGIIGLLILIFIVAVNHSDNTIEQAKKETIPLNNTTNITHSDSESSNPSRSNSSFANAKPSFDSTKPIVHPELFGMIEIGGKGVKGIVVDLTLVERDQACKTEDENIYADCVRNSITKSFEPYNVNPVEKKSMEDTVKAARKFFDEMIETYSVDPRQIYLVGSSSVSNINLVPHRDELKKALEDGLGNAIEMDLITAEEEGELGFRGTLNLIPKKWRDRRKKETVVLDIGSGDTKGGYMEIQEGHEEFIPVAVPWGAKTFTNEVDKQMKNAKALNDEFPEWAARLRVSLLRPFVHDEVSRKPGLINRTRVYLIGGIAWATSTLAHPEVNGPFPSIHTEYFDMLYRRAILSDAASKIYSANVMEQYPAIEKVRKAFTPENLVAGLEILRTFSDEMQFKNKDALFFIRDSLYAWPLGYITHRCMKDKTCPY